MEPTSLFTLRALPRSPETTRIYPKTTPPLGLPTIKAFWGATPLKKKSWGLTFLGSQGAEGGEEEGEGLEGARHGGEVSGGPGRAPGAAAPRGVRGVWGAGPRARSCSFMPR